MSDTPDDFVFIVDLMRGLETAISRALSYRESPELRDDRRVAEDDPPLDGVSLGDVVYLYDEDECSIIECPVVAKYEDHFYALAIYKDRPPNVEAVSEGWFWKTKTEVADHYKEEIMNSLECFKVVYEARKKQPSF